MTANQPLIQIRDLKVHFPITEDGVLRRRVGTVKAVDGISFEIERGQTLALVGESGCGKTTTGRAILQLSVPTAGKVTFDGQALTSLKGESLRRLRRRMQMTFQDPYAALNPRLTVAAILGEPLAVHNIVKGDVRRERVRELLGTVGLNPYYATRHPHEFSGGFRQRIAIARALAVEPDFLFCDEPVSALDASVRSQIIDLLGSLQQRYGLTYLLTAPDLSGVRHIANHVAIMYLGKIVELAARDELYDNPLHPYTLALFSTMPRPHLQGAETRPSVVLAGEAPSADHRPAGCDLNPRCPWVLPACRDTEPELRDAGGGHLVACFAVNT